MDLSRKKGASIWLSALLWSHIASRDDLYLHYGWTILDTPSHCVCSHKFGVDHPLSFLKRGFLSIRHNKVRDITASLLSEVCHEVGIEPHLQPLSGEHMNLLTANTDDSAHLDIAADGVWGSRFERGYFDV